MTKALIILGSSLTALAIARNAFQNHLRAIIISKNMDIATHSSAAKAAIYPDLSPKAIVDKVCDWESDKDRYLIATSDHWLAVIAQYRKKIESAGIRILHPDSEAIKNCIDKIRFARWCISNKIKVPAAYFPDSSEDLKKCKRALARGARLLVRPNTNIIATGVDMPKAVEINDLSSLEYWVKEFSEKGIKFLITESLLSHRLIQYSVGIVRSEKGIRSAVSVKERPFAKECAVGVLVSLSPDRKAEQLAASVAERIDYYGIGEVEILYSQDDNDYYVIEFNARPWIQYSLMPHSEHDFLKFLLKPEEYQAKKEMRDGKTWIHFSEDLFFCFSKSMGYVRNGKISKLEYLKSIYRANVYALFDLRDFKPCWISAKYFFRLMILNKAKIRA